MQMPMARLTAMLADMPRLVKKDDATKQFNSDEELKAWLLNE